MAEYFLSPTGNDTTGDGSSGNPWLTLAKAITGSASGDTITLKNGTYTGLTSWAITGSRIIQAETVGSVTTDWTSYASGAAITISANITVVLSGIIFRNATLPASSARFLSISLGNTGDVTIAKCVFEEIVTLPGFNTGNLLFVDSTNAAASLRIENCLFDDITKSSSGGNILALFCFNSSTTTILVMHCVFYFVTAAPNKLSYLVFNHSGSPTTTFVNNIISNASGESFTFSASALTDTTANYNDFHNITTAPSGTGNITGDPLFVDAAGGNFNLRPTSPCISTGTLV